MFEKIFNVFFDKIEVTKKISDNIVMGKARELKKVDLCLKKENNKNERKATSLSVYFCNLKSLYNYYGSDAPTISSNRLSRLQSPNSFFE